MRREPHHPLLTPGEVGAMFSVDAKTAVRWAKAGRFPAQYQGRQVVIRTGGDHHRFDAEAVNALRRGDLQWVKPAEQH